MGNGGLAPLIVMGDTAAIFPGQGAQAVGMGCQLASSCPAARSVYDRASRILGFDIAAVCFEGPSDRLEQTDIQQPAIFVTSAAFWEAYLDGGGSRQRFARAGGLSLGEYAALYAAGAMPFDVALRLVRRRGELMQQAALAAPSGMMSLIGADEKMALAVCDRARGDGVLVPANFNCPGQVVISGSQEALIRAEAIAGEMGCRAVMLPVAGAFHSPLTASAAEGLAAVLAESPIIEPSIPVIRNVDAAYHGDPASIREALRRQLTEPVLWQRCIERMVADGVDTFVEFGPGRVLTGLLRKINRKLAARNISTFEDLASIIE